MTEWFFVLLVLVANPQDQWFSCIADLCGGEMARLADEKSCERVKGDRMRDAAQRGWKVEHASKCRSRPLKEIGQ